ncbi:GNAT family N-acetyltransferase [Labrenzia sp. PHM005]|uniref:GNAT family N-acetyltransferase n=1 Tax=Labrenzia sp. PHM005 TaxID=2590016 RepID=UPI001AD9205D|nr:GNAT family N-acetyltransferase [Labrenzia sp. PHM005]
MQTIFLENDSVRLVPLSLSDIGPVKTLHADAYGNRCSDGDCACQSDEAEKLVHTALKNQEDLGVSRWKVEAEDGKFLGWAGFAPLAETSEICLSYCLSKAGGDNTDLPRRLCKALTEWFFKKTYFSHLVAAVRVDNRDMREVVLETGFYHRESKLIGGMQADVFQMLSPSMQTYLMSA